MSKERLMILDMLERGKITSADAEILFRALGEDEPGDVTAIPEVEVPHPSEPFLGSESNQPQEPQPAQGMHRVIGAIARVFSKPPSTVTRDRRRRYPDPSYAVAMKRSGLDFSLDQLFRMQEEDIDPEQAVKMVRESRPEWTTDDIVEMLSRGACPDVLSKLNEIGFEQLSPLDVIQLTEHDVDPEYLGRFWGTQMTGLTAHDLIEFAENDVDPDLVIALKEIGPITTADIVDAANNDLSPSFVRRMTRVLPGVTMASNPVHQLIELIENDVSTDFIEDLARGGFIDLTVKQIIKLRENDIDPQDAAWFREKLGEHITLEDVLRLANHDIDRDYVKPLLKFNLPDLSVDTLIEMYDHDVSAEDAAQAKKAFGDGFTAADLIDIADNR